MGKYAERIRNMILLYQRECITGFLVGFFFSIFNVIGTWLNQDRELYAGLFLIGCIRAILLDVVVGTIFTVFLIAMSKVYIKKEQDIGSYYKLFMIDFVGLLLFQLPVWLAYYPGLFAYDVGYQIPQKIGSYTTWQPLAHTLLLQFFYRIGEQIGNHTLGMALYVIFQAILLDLALAYMMLFLHRRKVRKGICIITFLFMALMPIYSVLAISMTKDILFAAFFLVFFLTLIVIEENPDNIEETEYSILFVISIVGMCVLRNNGIYVVLAVLIIGFIHLKRMYKKTFLTWAIIALLASFIVQEALLWGTMAKQGSINEMMSVPFQQIARVYQKEEDNLTRSEKAEIRDMFPSVENYNVHVSDAVKNTSNAMDHRSEFFDLYTSLLVQYPTRYIEAFLYNTMGYWYLEDTSFAEIYGYGSESRQGYFLTDTKGGFQVEHKSYFPALENLYQKLFSDNEYQNIPVLSFTFQPAFYFWLIILFAVYARYNKIRRAIMPFTLLIALFLTLFAGPCVLIRYAFPYIICVPALFVFLYGSTPK